LEPYLLQQFLTGQKSVTLWLDATVGGELVQKNEEDEGKNEGNKVCVFMHFL
jgi:hypothetical protein